MLYTATVLVFLVGGGVYYLYWRQSRHASPSRAHAGRSRWSAPWVRASFRRAQLGTSIPADHSMLVELVTATAKAYVAACFPLGGEVLKPSALVLRAPREILHVVEAQFNAIEKAILTEIRDMFNVLGWSTSEKESPQVLSRVFIGPVGARALFGVLQPGEDPFASAPDSEGAHPQRRVHVVEPTSSRTSTTAGAPVTPDMTRFSPRPDLSWVPTPVSASSPVMHLVVNGRRSLPVPVRADGSRVGRAHDAEVVLPQPDVAPGPSGEHLTVATYRSNQVEVVDTSRNGTFVQEGTTWRRLEREIPAQLSLPVVLRLGTRDVTLEIEPSAR